MMSHSYRFSESAIRRFLILSDNMTDCLFSVSVLSFK